jgi:hypothetical protein
MPATGPMPADAVPDTAAVTLTVPPTRHGPSRTARRQAAG